MTPEYAFSSRFDAYQAINHMVWLRAHFTAELSFLGRQWRVEGYRIAFGTFF